MVFPCGESNFRERKFFDNTSSCFYFMPLYNYFFLSWLVESWFSCSVYPGWIRTLWHLASHYDGVVVESFGIYKTWFRFIFDTKYYFLLDGILFYCNKFKKTNQLQSFYYSLFCGDTSVFTYYGTTMEGRRFFFFLFVIFVHCFFIIFYGYFYMEKKNFFITIADIFRRLQAKRHCYCVHHYGMVGNQWSVATDKKIAMCDSCPRWVIHLCYPFVSFI